MDELGRASTISAAPPDSTVDEPRTRAFLFCDLRDYTSFIEARGDRAGAALLERYRSIVRSAVARAAGAEIRTEGDSFYVVFPSASPAVTCGLDIVASARTATDRSPDAPIRVAVGIHAGESVEQAEGYVGSAVNIAARVCAEARAGEVLVTDIVRGLVRTSLDVTLTPRGSRRLKGIAEPIALYQVTSGPPARVGVRPRLGVRSRVGGVLALAGVLLMVAAALVVRPWASGGAAATSSPSALQSPSPGLAASASVGTSDLPGRLAFIASQVVGASEPRWQLYVVDAAGGDWRRMTELTDQVSLATWSPDGRELLYSLRGDENVPPRIVTVETAPEWIQRPWPSSVDHIEWQGTVYDLESVDWAPTDEVIIQGFSEYPTPSRIFGVSADGATVRLVTEPPPSDVPRIVYDTYPAVSPDGATIVFYSGESEAAMSIWAAGSDGTGRIQVTDAVIPRVGRATAAASGASWSPDGARLALAGRTALLGPVEVWTVTARGTDLRRLTEDDVDDDRPAWSPDGRWIAWTRAVSGRRQIWVMAADGTDPRPLVVGDEGEDLDLVGWAPHPT